MKILKWNLGLLIIKLGYKIRLYEQKPSKFNLRWELGRFILRKGYKLRGEIPQRRWKINN